MDQHTFALSSSNHFDEMVAQLDLPTFNLEVKPPTFDIQSPPQLSTSAPIYQPVFQQKDLGRIYLDIPINEIRNATLTLGNRNSQFDLNWEYFVGQLHAGIQTLHSQSYDTTAIFALFNMIGHLRTEMAMNRSGTYYSLLHLVEQRKKEESENARAFEASKKPGKKVAAKRKLDVSEPQAKRNKASENTPPSVQPIVTPLKLARANKKNKPKRESKKRASKVPIEFNDSFEM